MIDIYQKGSLTAVEDGLKGVTPQAVSVEEEHVIIPLKRFEELVKSEAISGVLLAVQRKYGNYRVEDVVKAVFPEEKGEDNAK